MSGSITIVGIGPGDRRMLTSSSAASIAAASDLVGYETYLDRVELRPGQRKHVSGNRVEIERARLAIELASKGANVAVISGGDPGVFAMAAAVFEAIETGEPQWRSLEVRVEPGVTAMLAAAAEVGAPLGGDFCAISLSDNLKSWETISRRLEAAARAGFVIALYNPLSKARPRQLGEAFDLLREVLPDETIVLMVRAAGTEDAKVHEATIATVDSTRADMRTLVLICSPTTRRIERPNGGAWIYTPRSEAELKR